MKIPLVDLAAQEGEVAAEALAAIAGVAREAKFVLGERVEAFERWLASTCGVGHAVGVASGTDAIELALRAFGVGRGDAVVTTALSFVAAAEAITATGARPVFCDVDPDTMNASCLTVKDAIARARAAGMRTRAIVPVHLFGLCAPGEEILELARAEEAFVVEDAAQALGARDDHGRPIGSASDATCFSFFPTKNLGAWGDAGAVVTPREDVAMRVRRLRAHGASAPYVHGDVGRNSRLDAVQAAVLLAKVGRFEGWVAARQRIATRYLTELADSPLELPFASLPHPAGTHGTLSSSVPSGATSSRRGCRPRASRRASTTRCRFTGSRASRATTNRLSRSRSALAGPCWRSRCFRRSKATVSRTSSST